MALAFLNRCIWRAASSGSGSFVVASAITGNRVPNDCANPAVVDGATYRYFAQSDDKTQWEIGYDAFDVTTSTLPRTNILDSSNSGSVVTFSAAPSVFMGGPLAQDVHWVVIGDTTVSSPVAEVAHSFNPALYSEIKSCAIDIVPETLGTPPGYLYYEIYAAGGSPSYPNSTITISDSGIASQTANSVFLSTTNVISFVVGYATVTGSAIGANKTYTSLDLSGGAVSSVAVSDEAEPLNIASGRVITYGLLRP